MYAYVLRRLLTSIVILFLASALMFWLVSNSGDPLADLLTDTSANKDQKIQARVAALHLDQPLISRYFLWLGGAVSCVVPGMTCNLGTNIAGQQVTGLLTAALGSTLKLVLLATVLSVVLGVAVGIFSALRQYSGFDYGVTFIAFLFFSLPVFWVAVLLKQFGAIELNNWLTSPTISVPVTLATSGITGLTFAVLIGGGDRRRSLIAGFIAALVVASILTFWSLTQWWLNPSLGPLVVALMGAGIAVGATVLTAGIEARAVLWTGLSTVLVATVVALAGRSILMNPTPFGLFLLGAIVLSAAVVIGVAFGGIDRATAIRVGIVTAISMGLLIGVDYVLANFATYSSKVGGRPIATIGAQTPNFSGNLWQRVLDSLTHLVLPTLAIMLISFATYSRYTRASMLETTRADYVRTARAKGLPERTVILRHAFGNALIPVVTLAALDFGAVIGGAVITETVFGWKGMGQLFREGLARVDTNQVMGFFVVVAIAVLVFNLIADLSYAWLDPRVRLQ